MIDFLNDIDHQLFLALHSAFRNGFMDVFMKMFSGRWVWVPFYVSLAVMAMLNIRDRSKFIAFLLAAGVAIAITDQTCASVIRPYVGRLRPSNPDNPISSMVMVVDGYRGGSYGFPSCHSANSLALAVFMSMAVGRRWFAVFILGWAVINSLSRIYLGVHYPGDLLVGGLIGSAVGAGCYYVWARACRVGLAESMRWYVIPVVTASVIVVTLMVISAVRV